jgi:hypothetical protein
MPTARYTGFAWQSEPSQLTGDLSFAGIDTKTVDPALLAPGAYQRAQNYRNLQGTMRPRRGMIPPPAINSVSYGTILGCGVFFDAEGNEFVCIGNSAGVWVTSPGQAPYLVTLASGAVIQGPCQFIQAFDQLFLFQGPTIAPLLWNGDTSSMFTTLPSPFEPDLTTIPDATYAEYVYSQLFVPFGKDQIAVSQINDYTSYFAALDVLEINSGQDDGLVRILSWAQGACLLFKSQSIFILVNANQQIATLNEDGSVTQNPNVVLQQISSRIGLVGQKAVATYGTEVAFMDYSGIYKISQVFEAQPQTAAIPFSWPMQYYFDQINFAYASGVVGQAHREYVYFAVPLGDVTRNNALFVYNIQYDRWEGIDTFGDPNFFADDMMVATVNGEKRILLVDKVRGIVTLYEEGLVDITGEGTFNTGWFWIPTLFQSRGYALNNGDTRVRFKMAEIRMGGWQPEYSITAVQDSQFATQNVATNRTKLNTKYLTVGTPDWNPSNTNNDWSNPFREDYSAYLGEVVGSGFYLQNGVVFETRQNVLERFRVRRNSNSCSLLITNATGTLDIQSIMFDVMPVDRSEKSWGG